MGTISKSRGATGGGGVVSWTRAKNTKEKLLTPRPCAHCGQPMSREFLEEKQRVRRERIKSALAQADRVGRPKTRDDDAIRELRRAGKSIRAIARELNCSTWSVQRSLKARP